MELVSSNAVSQVAKMTERGMDPNFHDERSGGVLHTDNNTLDDFSKISEDSPKLVHRCHECCQTFSENF